MKSSNDRGPWKILSVVSPYENPWISVHHHEVINPSGGKGIYGVVHFKNQAIGILPVDDEGNIYLVGQYRFAISTYSWEIPEGGAPQGEDPLVAAKRELKEETGLVAADWELLGRAYLSNSVSDEESFYFLARGLSQQEACPEETEALSVKKITLKEAFLWLDEGKITDALSILALQAFRQRNTNL